MTRIIHLANFYGPRSGGLRTMMRELASEYDRRGIEVLHVVPGESDSVIERDGLTVHQLASPVVPRSGGYRVVVDIGAVRRILRHFQPDVIEVSDRLSMLHSVAPLRASGVPVAMFAHERVDGVIRANAAALPAVRIANAMNRWAITKSDHIIATTEFAAAEFRRIGVEPAVVPLAVDTEMFRPERRVIPGVPLRDRPLVLGVCSRLSPEKACHIPIEAVRLAVRDGLDVTLEIVGAGPMEAELRERARGLPVTFHGFLRERETVASFLANLDVLLAPGPIETFGLAALESLSSGTPVISHAHSAIPEVIGNAGYAAEPGPEHWVAAIARSVAAGAPLRAAARARALEFSWSATADALLSQYGVEATVRGRVRAPSGLGEVASNR